MAVARHGRSRPRSPPAHRDRMSGAIQESHPLPRPRSHTHPPREQEVLALLAGGLADREISERPFISERTVQHHVSEVLSKIGVSSRTAAAREAAKLGIGS